MKSQLFIAALSSIFCINAFASTESPNIVDGFELTMDGRTIQEATSAVIPIDLDTKEIITRAQTCAVRFAGQDKSQSPTVLEYLGGIPKASNDMPSPTIELVDKDGGQLIVNNSGHYHYSLVSFVAKSKMIIEAREKRFRISLTNLVYGSGDKGANYWPIKNIAGSGWNSAMSALITPANQIANCITQTGDAKKDNW